MATITLSSTQFVLHHRYAYIATHQPLCVSYPQDETTMKDLAAEDVTTDVQGWLRWAHAHFLQVDLFKSVPASDTLMRIHSTAEEFDSTAEDFLAPFQVSVLVDIRSLLSRPFMPGSVPP